MTQMCYAEKKPNEYMEDHICGYLLYQRTVGALQYDDYKGPNRQYADQDKLIIQMVEDNGDRTDSV